MNLRISNFNWKSQSFLILFLAALIQFTASIVTNSVVIILPDISRDLSVNVNILNWVTLIFFMTTVSCAIPLSKVISQYGVKKYTKFAILALIIGLVISGITMNVELFLFSRVIQGVSIAILNVSVYMMIVLGLDENETGKALGIIGSAGYIGLTISPTLTGFVSYFLSWRFAFFLIVPILALQLIIIYFIKDEWKTDRKPIDNMGSLFYVLLIVSLAYGLSEIKKGGYVFLVGFIIFAAIYIIIERKKEHPLYNLKLLKDVRYLIGNYAAMVSYFITFIAAYILSLYLQIALGFDSKTAGLLLFIQPIIMVFFAPYAGRLSDRKDARLISAFAMLFLTIAMTMLIFLEHLPFYMIVVVLILQGIGHGMFSSPNNRYVITLVDVDDLPDASSLLATIKEFGKLFSLSIFNIICMVYMGNTPVQKSVGGLIQSSRTMIIITAFVSLSSMILLLLSKYYFEKDENPEVIAIMKKVIPKWLKEYFN